MTASTSINIYEPNELNDSGTYDFTTADEANASFLYDRSSITQLISVGSADGTNEMIKVTFVNPVYIDHCAVLNHNIKTGTLKYLNSGGTATNFSTPAAWSGNTTITNSPFNFTQVLAYGIQLDITYTIDASQKRVGQLLALKLAFAIGVPFSIEPSLKIKKNLKEKVDGGTDKLVQGIKHLARMSFDNMTAADVSNYFLLAGRGEPFYINLSGLSTNKDREFFRLQDYYLVNMINDAEPKIKKGHLNDASWDGVVEWAEV